MHDPNGGRDPGQSERQFEAELRTRLRPVCGALPEPEFERLVRDIARMAERFREIEADPALWRTVDQRDRPLAPLPPAPPDAPPPA
jgi:hypothetical protein